MATDAPHPCPSCGAHVPADADRCDLCGAPIDDASSSEADAAQEPDPQESSGSGSDAAPSSHDAPSPHESSEEAGVFCNECGWENPADANFCSQCGTELQDLSRLSRSPEGTRPVTADLPRAPESPGSSAPSSPSETTPSDAEEDAEQQTMGRQITLYIGGAALIVVALFFVTLWSQSQNWGSTGSSTPNGPQASSQSAPDAGPAAQGGGAVQGGGPGAGPASRRGSLTTDLRQLASETGSEIPTGLSERVDSLQRVIQNASGTPRQNARGELVNLYVGAGQTGRAAVLQQRIAEASDSLAAWRRAGDLLYRWMQEFQQQGQRRQAFPVAQAAATAYEAVAERTPDDLRARTRMGESYLLTNSPMKGIETINQVLAEDSTFVPARFQKGLAFLQISRFEQAIAEFERVKQFSSEGEPYYRQADRAIQIIRERTRSSSSGGQAPSSTPQD